MLVVLFLFAAVKVAREYERGIIFRLGRLLPEPKGPGLFLLIPIVDRMVKVDLRTITLNIPPQEVITKDNVPARVNAVAYFRIVAPKDAIVQVENFMVATSQIAQTTLRSVLGQHLLDELLSERDKINAILQEIIDTQTAPWGIKVSIVEVKDVEIPSGMQRAMARQAEAERERRAKVINAEGEYQASERLRDAAAVMAEEPIAIQLRYLQTLLEIGASNSSTIVFPAPIDLIQPLLERAVGPRAKRPAAKPAGRRQLDDCAAPVLLAEPASSVDRRAEVQALVLRLLDQHHGLDRVDVVDPLLPPLGRDLGLVRPVVELHLRDPRDLAHLAEVELELVQMLGEVYRFQKVHLPAERHTGIPFRRRAAAAGASLSRSPPLVKGRVSDYSEGCSSAGRTTSSSTVSSTSESATGARLETFSPSRSRTTITPWVARPSRLISSTDMRITVPPVEISISW